MTSSLRAWFRGDGVDRHTVREQMQSLLPTSQRLPPSPIPSKEITIIALRLKHQIEQVIPCELPLERITQPHSDVLTPAVLATAKSAGGEENRAAVVFCLLVVKRWFWLQSKLELWETDTHILRARACEMLAKQIIEEEDDLGYLMGGVLLTRYSFVINSAGEESSPANAVEKAVDLHALRVIGSSGFQKTIEYLWRGWLVQDDEDPTRFVEYKEKSNDNYWAHLDPDRMKAPKYQNAVQIAISLIYLGLFTGAINTINPSADLDFVEVLLYIFTLGFICDEVSKLFKIGIYYLQFWNLFNAFLYILLTVSFVLRMAALAHPLDSDDRTRFNELSYYFLACCAPLFWGRMLLFLDGIKFFGAMVIVTARMLRESVIFLSLLVVILAGFLQSFVGLDQVDENLTTVKFITQAMLNAIMTSPDFSGFDNYAPPFGLILYYIYTFVVMVVLLNILIALYNSAYQDITDNATDEYLALFAQKTMQFVRAPDENVFIPPFNLIEIFLLVLPLEWWLPHKAYQKLNAYVMLFIYSPLLVITAALETREAKSVKDNRNRRAQDDDTVEEWEQLEDQCDFERDGWAKKVEETKPNVETPAAVLEIEKLREEVAELKKLLEKSLTEK